jgi:hypothetical protein
MRNEGYKYKDEDVKRLVGVVSFVKCNICKKNYVPDDKDVSLNGNLYYKNCKICRRSRVEMKEKSLNKTKPFK